MTAADTACVLVPAAQTRSPVAIPSGWHKPVAPGRYDLLVVGAGPAGLVAARTAAAAGAKVALVEGRQIGSNCMHAGCIPSKTFICSASLYADMRDAAAFGVRAPTDMVADFGAAMARVQRIRKRLGQTCSPAVWAAESVDLYFGYARFVGTDAVDMAGYTLRFKKALVATGSRPVWSKIEGLAKAGFLSSETVFDLQVQPPSLLVIGGGPLGCELAQAFARFGTRTLISHSAPLFLPKEERDAAQMVSDALARDGVEIHLNCHILSVRPEGGRQRVQM